MNDMTPSAPLSSLLDSVYELEGLIHLALNREEIPSSLFDLICRKADSIAIAAPEAVEAIASMSRPADKEIEGSNSDYQLPDDDSQQTFSQNSPDSPEPALPPVQNQDSPAGSIAEEEVIPMETVSPDYNLDSDYSESSEFNIESSATPSQAAAPASATSPSAGQTHTPHTIPGKSAKRGKLVFNLNDRYRFRRTLFAGNDSEFTAALNKAAEFDLYEQAEGYFITQLGWEPENSEVKAFMDLLRNYYK